MKKKDLLSRFSRYELLEAAVLESTAGGCYRTCISSVEFVCADGVRPSWESEGACKYDVWKNCGDLC